MVEVRRLWDADGAVGLARVCEACRVELGVREGGSVKEVDWERLRPYVGFAALQPGWELF